MKKKEKKIIIDKKQEEEKFREIDELLPIFLYFHEFLQQEQQPLQKNTKDEQKNKKRFHEKK